MWRNHKSQGSPSCGDLKLITALMIVAMLSTAAVCQADNGLPFWRTTIVNGVTSGGYKIAAKPFMGDESGWKTAVDIPPLQQSVSGHSPVTNKGALKRALMSAVLPGSGQLRNGSLLRGLGYVALELTGWIAYSRARSGIDDKKEELGTYASNYWFVEQYREGAFYSYYDYDQESDSLIVSAMNRNQSRFYDYLSRESYACGWDTTRTDEGATDGMTEEEQNQFYRDLRSMHKRGYLALWHDREDLRSTKTFVGRMIFLNHLISAVDAFIEARKIRLSESGDLGVNMGSISGGMAPQIVYTHRFN